MTRSSRTGIQGVYKNCYAPEPAKLRGKTKKSVGHGPNMCNILRFTLLCRLGQKGGSTRPVSPSRWYRLLHLPQKAKSSCHVGALLEVVETAAAGRWRWNLWKPGNCWPGT